MRKELKQQELTDMQHLEISKSFQYTVFHFVLKTKCEESGDQETEADGLNARDGGAGVGKEGFKL